MRALFRVGQYLRAHRGWAIATFLCAALVTMVDLLPPWLIKVVIDRVIQDGQTGLLPWILLILVGAYAVRHLVNGVRIYCNNALEQRVIHHLRGDVHRTLLSQSFSFFENRATGELMSRVTNDVENLERIFVDGIEHFLVAVLTLLGITVMLLTLNWKLALLALLPVPIIAFGMARFTTRIHALYHALRQKLAAMHALLQDQLTGVREILAFTHQEHEGQRFMGRSQDYCQANMDVALQRAISFPALMFLGSLGTVLVVWVGTHQVIAGALTVGGLVAFLSYLAQFYTPLNQIHSLNHMVQHALAAGERVFELMDARPEVVETPGAIEPHAPLQGYVRFHQVSFRYRPELPVLHEVSLEAGPGEIVALVGSSGSGKTTLVSLLLRFYDLDSGSLTIDGYDIRRFSLAYLRRQIGLVRQEPFLFNGTVRENLAYGDLTATARQIEEAAQLAGATPFISRLPQGYDTWLGERGVKLSMGERQRLALARVLLKDPPVLILDEATSNVDAQAESAIHEALRPLLARRTVFIIAHRLSTLKMASRVVVIEGGHIVEDGSHGELLQRNGAYTGLIEAQLFL